MDRLRIGHSHSPLVNIGTSSTFVDIQFLRNRLNHISPDTRSFDLVRRIAWEAILIWFFRRLGIWFLTASPLLGLTRLRRTTAILCICSLPIFGLLFLAIVEIVIIAISRRLTRPDPILGLIWSIVLASFLTFWKEQETVASNTRLGTDRHLSNLVLLLKARCIQFNILADQALIIKNQLIATTIDPSPLDARVVLSLDRFQVHARLFLFRSAGLLGVRALRCYRPLRTTTRSQNQSRKHNHKTFFHINLPSHTCYFRKIRKKSQRKSGGG